MDKNTQIALGVVAVAAAAGAGYYFLVYKPAKEKEEADKKQLPPSGAPALPPGDLTTQMIDNRGVSRSMLSPFASASSPPSDSGPSVASRSVARSRVRTFAQPSAATPPAPPPPTFSQGGAYKIPGVGGVAWGADANVTFDQPNLTLSAGGDATIAVVDASDQTIGSYKLAQGQKLSLGDILKSAGLNAFAVDAAILAIRAASSR